MAQGDGGQRQPVDRRAGHTERYIALLSLVPGSVIALMAGDASTGRRILVVVLTLAGAWLFLVAGPPWWRKGRLWVAAAGLGCTAAAVVGGLTVPTDSRPSTPTTIAPDPVIMATVVGAGRSGRLQDGALPQRALLKVCGIAAADPHVLYVAAGETLRRVTLGRSVVTVAGQHGYRDGSGGSGPATKALLDSACAVAVDGPRRLVYIAGRDGRVRVIDAAGTIRDINGGADDASRMRSFGTLEGLACDSDGNLYISSSSRHRIWRYSRSEAFTVVAGIGAAGFDGDGGPARLAWLNQPGGITVAADGSLFVADTGNNRIRRIDKAGHIATVAGVGGEPGFNGDDQPATAAQLGRPTAVAVAPDGTIYFSEGAGQRVRAVGPDGRIRTVAGDGSAGWSGDGGPPEQAQLWSPSSLAVASDGVLYIADTGNWRVRAVGRDSRLADYVPTPTPRPSVERFTGEIATAPGRASPLLGFLSEHDDRPVFLDVQWAGDEIPQTDPNGYVASARFWSSCVGRSPGQPPRSPECEIDVLKVYGQTRSSNLTYLGRTFRLHGYFYLEAQEGPHQGIVTYSIRAVPPPSG